MKVKAMLDRIEDGRTAVLIAEEEGLEFTTATDNLPEGSRVDDWFELDVEDGGIVSIERKEDETDERQAKAEGLLERLRKRSSGSKFKKE